MTPPAKPLLVFDGDCGFCRSWIARWRHRTGDRVDYVPYQSVAARFPEIPPERFRYAVQLIEPDGHRTEGAEAVFRSLACAPRGGMPLAFYRHVPGFAGASEWCYRRVARNRALFTKLTRLLWGEHVAAPPMDRTAWIFMRLLGVVFLVAFVSLGSQILGLVGHEGILPAREYLDQIRAHYGWERVLLVPSLAWFGASDTALLGMCWGGAAAALLLAVGVAPLLTLGFAWLAYLSLAGVCEEFLWFQWDSLLLETGFLALFLAPWVGFSRPDRDPPPSRIAIRLLRWLLFRLMFSSAVVKLTSGDPNWRHLEALRYHYETQPLPPWTAWYAHHLPQGFQRLSVAVMFAIEGLAPFLIAAPRHLRFLGAAALAGLQTLIVVTGNYGFFNLLALVLCILLLDDAVWPWVRVSRRQADAAPARGWPAWLLRPIAVALVVLSFVPMFAALRWPMAWLGPLPALHQLTSPYQISNSYGLFMVMTTERPEIVVEGSNDGATWRPYEFRWKPGDVTRRPEFQAPHMPRLDWQMWFAALGDLRAAPWFLYFSDRLLRGSRPVLGLLARNPFPDAPPRFLRATVWDYHFTTVDERRTTGAWWRRTPRGPFTPVLALEQGQLIAVPDSVRH